MRTTISLFLFVVCLPLFAQTITNLPASPTLTINYPGDALYQSGPQQVRLVETRRRAGH
jgi:hypothetical protein